MKRAKSYLLYCLLFTLTMFAIVNARGHESAMHKKKIAFTRLQADGFSTAQVYTMSKRMLAAVADTARWSVIDFPACHILLAKRGGTINCSDLECAISNGKLLKTDYLCYGSIKKSGQTYVINVKVAEMFSGELVADVSKYFKYRKLDNIYRIIPIVGKEAATAIIGKEQREDDSTTSTPLQMAEEKKSRRISYDAQESTPSFGEENKIETAGKLAFGYFSVGNGIGAETARRYSYQFQSYIADVGAFTMLYPDEMEQLMSKQGGSLQCGSMKCALNLGRKLGVKYMGYGKIKRFFRFFMMEICIVDVEHGTRFIKKKRWFNVKETIFLREIIPQFAYKLGERLERKRMSERNAPNGQLSSYRKPSNKSDDEPAFMRVSSR